MRESPYHGLNFCQGTVGEMLDDPAREIGDVIRWFGERGKLFNVHFRNIRGRRLELHGDLPRRRRHGHGGVAAALRRGRLQIHGHARPRARRSSGRDPDGTAFAFCYGYIAGALQMMGVEPTAGGATGLQTRSGS